MCNLRLGHFNDPLWVDKAFSRCYRVCMADNDRLDKLKSRLTGLHNQLAEEMSKGLSVADTAAEISTLAASIQQAESTARFDDIRAAQQELAVSIREVIRHSRLMQMGTLVESLSWSYHKQDDGKRKLRIMVNPKSPQHVGQGGWSQKFWRRKLPDGTLETLTTRDLVDKYAPQDMRRHHYFDTWPAALIPRINAQLNPPFEEISRESLEREKPREEF